MEEKTEGLLNLPPVLLASGSSRRQELLRKMDVSFEIRVKPVDEVFPSDLPVREVPEYLARLKSEAFLTESQTHLIITADTDVILGQEVLGKPGSREEAVAMIEQLSGRTHEVISGVCLSYQGNILSFDDTTFIRFRPLERAEIEYYVDRYQPYDKAGAYGIQEWIGMIGIEEMDGSYFNVVGLPVERLWSTMKLFRRTDNR